MRFSRSMLAAASVMLVAACSAGHSSSAGTTTTASSVASTSSSSVGSATTGAGGPTTTRAAVGTLDPSPPGSGQCNGVESTFPNGDEAVQLNRSNMVGTNQEQCTLARDVTSGAEAAHGGSYTKDGFACTGSASTAGPNTNANFGPNPYWNYSCTNGGQQMAFTFGKWRLAG